MSGHRRHLKWDKLDNTGNLFPVIARPGMSNVYRVAVLLKEEINEELLQKALEQVLPYFENFLISTASSEGAFSGTIWKQVQIHFQRWRRNILIHASI